MKRVVITGASGFVGRHLFPFLKERGYEIFPCYHKKKQEFPNYTHPVCVNILDQDSRAYFLKDIKPTHLIHLAWYVNPTDYLDSMENVDWIVASVDLYKEFAKNGGKRCVSVGSCAEYNWSENILKEDTTSLQNNNLYSYAKNITHLCLEKLSRASSFDMVWARIFWLYGPGESPKRFLPTLISTLLKGETFTCKDPYKEIDLMHVEDVAYSLVCALDSNITGSLNIASGKTISIESIIKDITSILDCPQLIKLEFDNKVQTKVKADTEKISSLPNFNYKNCQYSGLKKYIEYIKNSNC